MPTLCGFGFGGGKGETKAAAEQWWREDGELEKSGRTFCFGLTGRGRGAAAVEARSLGRRVPGGGLAKPKQPGLA